MQHISCTLNQIWRNLCSQSISFSLATSAPYFYRSLQHRSVFFLFIPAFAGSLPLPEVLLFPQKRRKIDGTTNWFCQSCWGQSVDGGGWSVGREERWNDEAWVTSTGKIRYGNTTFRENNFHYSCVLFLAGSCVFSFLPFVIGPPAFFNKHGQAFAARDFDASKRHQSRKMKQPMRCPELPLRAIRKRKVLHWIVSCFLFHSFLLVDNETLL